MIRMGVDTKGYMKGNVTATEVYDIVCEKFDKDAQFGIKIDNYDKEERGFIYFEFAGEKRQLFYCTGETERLSDFPLIAEKSDDKIVYLILGYWGSSVEIMTEVVKEFGGYVDDNDCDDIEAYYITKDSNFVYSEYLAMRDNVINILDENLNQGLKLQIAAQIMKHKEELLEQMK